MALQQIKKVQIGEQVYNQMRSQIVEGNWKPGEKIPSESALMTAFGVSRVTVRQAIQKLAGEDLVETRRGEGSFVRAADIDTFFKTSAPLLKLGAREIKEIFEFRTVFESGIIELTAKKITKEQLTELEQNYSQLQKSVDHVNEFVKLDLKFHELICEFTGNTLVNQIFLSYGSILKPAIDRMVEVIGVENGIKYHRLIIDALKDGNAELARQTMIQHLQTNMDLFYENIKQTIVF